GEIFISLLRVAVIEHAQFRREARHLFLPVEYQRPRHDHQRRIDRFACGAQFAPRLEQGEHLRSLSHAHVVGEAPAEREPPQKMHPNESLALVVAKASHEARGLLAGRYILEGLQLPTDSCESLVASRLRLRSQESIEQTRLAAPEADVAVFGVSHR